MRSSSLLRVLPLLAAALSPSAEVAGQTVRALLLHSPTCPHCRQVIGQDLPVFFQVYGGEPRVTTAGPAALLTNGKLEILLVDASRPEGGPVYEASMRTHPVSQERLGVPRLIVGDSVLVGSVEIPARLHAIIRNGLASGGIDWPPIPGLAELLAAFPGTTAPPPAPPPLLARPRTAQPATTLPPPQEPTPASAPDTLMARDTAPPTAAPSLAELAAERPTTVGERLRRDPAGNALAIVVLAGMVGVVIAVLSGAAARRAGNPGLLLPVLALLGAGAAAYLTYVETSGATAVCGPVGDCNTVQQSAYANVFGVPVGVLGLVGYGIVLALWALGLQARAFAAKARRLLVGVALAGTAFSIYLTFLEPFVIGATCLWCLSSAVLITAILWLAARWVSASAPAP